MALSTFAGSPAAAPGAFLGVKGPSTVNPARLPALLGCRDGAATGPNGSTASRWDASPCVWSVASASRRTTRNHCDAHAAAALSPWLPVAEQAMVAISRPRPRDMSWPTSTGSVSPDGAPTCAGPAGIPSAWFYPLQPSNFRRNGRRNHASVSPDAHTRSAPRQKLVPRKELVVPVIGTPGHSGGCGSTARAGAMGGGCCSRSGGERRGRHEERRVCRAHKRGNEQAGGLHAWRG